MMRMLSARSADFSQVIAIDANYMIFNRAWCIAELAAASAAGMPQQLKVLSFEGFKNHHSDLRGLRIQDMEASYAPDREAILRKIGDEVAGRICIAHHTGGPAGVRGSISRLFSPISESERSSRF